VDTIRVSKCGFFFRLLSLSFFLLTVVPISPCFAAEETETIAAEFPLSRASFLLSVARFTTWPDSAFTGRTSPLVFCIYKDRETGRALHGQLQGETINGRSLRQVDIESFIGLSRCHVVYLPSEKMNEYPFAAGNFYGKLTISDSLEFAETGGMLGFVRGDQEVKIFVNPEILTNFGLSICPSLLEMAELVHTRKNGPENGPAGR
jgi:hypothetical protein